MNQASRVCFSCKTDLLVSGYVITLDGTKVLVCPKCVLTIRGGVDGIHPSLKKAMDHLPKFNEQKFYQSMVRAQEELLRIDKGGIIIRHSNEINWSFKHIIPKRKFHQKGKMALEHKKVLSNKYKESKNQFLKEYKRSKYGFK